MKVFLVFLHHKREKALEKAIHTIDLNAYMQRNTVYHLEKLIIMYGVYNVDTFDKLIQMVHKMNERMIWFEDIYVGHMKDWYDMYSFSQGVNYYVIHSMLYLRAIQEKYVKMYERYVYQLKRIFTSNQNIIKRIFVNITFIAIKIS